MISLLKSDKKCGRSSSQTVRLPEGNHSLHRFEATGLGVSLISKACSKQRCASAERLSSMPANFRIIQDHGKVEYITWLVVSTPLRNISQLG